MKNRTCQECCCVDSEENPVIEIVDEEGFVEEMYCMMCYVEKLGAEG